jgi:BirA family biotin operon repressor/biotin-[acetyl-CoA-carboxylase] ligase
MTIGTIIHRLSSCSSTNDVAKALAQAGAEEGTVVIAGEQTAGKGTKGRTWHSPSGQGLYASIILRPRRKDISLLPLVAGVACAEAIREAAGLEVRLRWPNDIFWKAGKLGGILCEGVFLGSSSSYAVMGIGLNITQRRSDFPADLRGQATSLRLALKKPADREALEASLWRSLDRWYSAFRLGKKRQIVRAFESQLIIPIGTVVKVRREKDSLEGVFAGMDTRARLVLIREGKKRLLSPAEILGIDYNE